MSRLTCPATSGAPAPVCGGHFSDRCVCPSGPHIPWLGAHAEPSAARDLVAAARERRAALRVSVRRRPTRFPPWTAAAAAERSGPGARRSRTSALTSPPAEELRITGHGSERCFLRIIVENSACGNGTCRLALCVCRTVLFSCSEAACLCRARI